MDVANYKKDDTTNDYYKIYGDIPELTDKSKVFYFTIKAYDEAKRIPIDGSTPTAEDNKGNESVTYYLYEAISADPILSLFKITDLYHMKNGTFSLSSAEANREAVSKTVEQVVGKLADPALNIDTGRFSLRIKQQLQKKQTHCLHQTLQHIHGQQTGLIQKLSFQHQKLQMSV